MRVGYEFVQSPSTVTSGTGSVTVTVRIYVWTQRSVVDSTNTLSWSGSFGSGSQSVSINHGSSSSWSTSNRTLVKTLSRSFAPHYTGRVASTIGASLSGINAVPGTASVSGTHYTAQRPIDAPDPLNSVSVSRGSDTSHTLSFSRASTHGSASKPYENIIVQRWDDVGGSYRTIATLGNVTSYTDRSTVSNRRYRYRVAARNSAGTSSYTPSSYFYTSPTTPGNVKASKSGSDIVVSWNRYAYDAAQYEVRIYANGSLQTTVTTSANAQSYTHSSPDSGKTHYYTVRARVSDSAFGVLTSSWSSPSNTVQLAAPPNAPTNLRPNVAVDASEANVLSWDHNAVDTSEQRQYELRWRFQGDSSWTSSGTVVSGTSARTIPADTWSNGQTVEWQVRTWGDHATASPYSAIALLQTSERPSATIDVPGETVIGTRTDLSWTYFDPEGSSQSSYRAKLLAGAGTTGDVLWQKSGSTASSASVDYRLEDGATYTAVVEVRDGLGLWSLPSTQVFTVEYANPPVGNLDLSWDIDLGAVVAAISHPAPTAEEAEPVYSELYRSIDGGESWALIATNLPLNTSILDPIPATNAPNLYRLVTVSDLPSTAETVPEEIVPDPRGRIYLSAGPNFSETLWVKDNARVSSSEGVPEVLHRMAGRTRPGAIPQE